MVSDEEIEYLQKVQFLWKRGWTENLFGWKHMLGAKPYFTIDEAIAYQKDFDEHSNSL